MTNQSGFAQSEADKIKESSNLAKTQSRLQKNSEGSKYHAALRQARTTPTFRTDPPEGLQPYEQPPQDENPGVPKGSFTIATDELKTTYLPDQTFQNQIALIEVLGNQQQLQSEVAADLDILTDEAFTDHDIKGVQATGAESRATIAAMGDEQRANLAEEGSQTRGTIRTQGQEDRGNIAEEGSQTRATRRVEGQEVRETDLQREMFRRYKESRDYGQAQSAARSY